MARQVCSVKMAAIVFDTCTESHFLHHFKIIISTLLEPCSRMEVTPVAARVPALLMQMPFSSFLQALHTAVQGKCNFVNAIFTSPVIMLTSFFLTLLPSSSMRKISFRKRGQCQGLREL